MTVVTELHKRNVSGGHTFGEVQRRMMLLQVTATAANFSTPRHCTSIILAYRENWTEVLE